MAGLTAEQELVLLHRVARRLGVDRLDKVLASARDVAGSGCVEMAVAETAEDEARLISDRIAGLIHDGHEPTDTAVLYRSARTSARPLVDALRARSVPVTVVGKTTLLARPEPARVAHISIWRAGGTWYPNSRFEPETVTPESLCDEIRRVIGADEREAERIVAALERIGARAREEAVKDSVPLFNEIIVALGLPRSGADEQAEELALGRMSELLTELIRSLGGRRLPRALREPGRRPQRRAGRGRLLADVG